MTVEQPVDVSSGTAIEDTAAPPHRHLVRWIVLAVLALLAVLVAGASVWASTVSALANAGSSGLRSSAPVVSFYNAEQPQTFAMFRDGAPMTVMTSLRNETAFPITITGLFADPHLDGDCTWVVERIRTADAFDERLRFREFAGDLVLEPDQVIQVLAHLKMACGQFTRGATQSWSSMLATYTIGGLIHREQQVDLQAKWGWANYRDPQRFIDDNVEIE
jgi:hypothetical protein